VTVLALDTFAGAATPPVGKRGIDVVQVEGYLDPPNVSLILDAIHDANARRSTLLVLQVKSNGAIDTDIEQVVRAIQRSKVPIAVWVGPSGAACSQNTHTPFTISCIVQHQLAGPLTVSRKQIAMRPTARVCLALMLDLLSPDSVAGPLRGSL
jgi:hypothetical protein